MGKAKRLVDLAVGAGLVLGLACASLAAEATTIAVSYAGGANFGAGSVGYQVGSIAPNPVSSTNLKAVGIGGDSYRTTDTSLAFSSTGLFNAWCVDIYHWLSGSNPITYSVENEGQFATALQNIIPNPPPTPPAYSTRVSDLVRLADLAYKGLSSKTDSAAFQLAVWAITYGTQSGGLYHVGTTDSKFKVDSSTASSPATTEANGWLTNLGNASLYTGNYTLTYLSDGAYSPTEPTQDLVVFTSSSTPGTTGSSVPEPGTLALLGLGLTALGLRRRRRA